MRHFRSLLITRIDCKLNDGFMVTSLCDNLEINTVENPSLNGQIGIKCNCSYTLFAAPLFNSSAFIKILIKKI